MEKHMKLVMLLTKKTLEGKIDWKATINEEIFRVSFSDNSIQIFPKRNRNSQVPDYVIEMINSDGNVVDSFTDVTLANAPEGNGDVNWFANMESLYNAARRSALGSDKVLNSILSELDE